MWEAGYTGMRAPSAGSPYVEIRSVEWQRIDSTLRELERQMAASNVDPDQWTPRQKSEAHATLIRALEIPEDPRRLEVLGRSDFATSADVRPTTAVGRDQLEKLAGRVGADVVVWSSRAFGEMEGSRGSAYIAFFLRRINQ